MKLQIKIAFKLFHQDRVAYSGTVDAAAVSFFNATRTVVTTAGFVPVAGATIPAWVQPAQVVPTVRRHVEEFLKDTRYSILYDPESGIESQIKVL